MGKPTFASHWVREPVRRATMDKKKNGGKRREKRKIGNR